MHGQDRVHFAKGKGSADYVFQNILDLLKVVIFPHHCTIGKQKAYYISYFTFLRNLIFRKSQKSSRHSRHWSIKYTVPNFLFYLNLVNTLLQRYCLS